MPRDCPAAARARHRSRRSADERSPVSPSGPGLTLAGAEGLRSAPFARGDGGCERPLLRLPARGALRAGPAAAGSGTRSRRRDARDSGRPCRRRRPRPAPPPPPADGRAGSASRRRGNARIDSSALPYPGVPPPVGSGSIACGPPTPRSIEEAAATGSPGGYRRAGEAGRRRDGGPGPRLSRPPASASAPDSTAAAWRGPGPEGPLPAARPSPGSAPPSRRRGGEGQPPALSSLRHGRGRGERGPPPGLCAAPPPSAPGPGLEGAPQAPAPPSAGRLPPASPRLLGALSGRLWAR